VEKNTYTLTEYGRYCSELHKGISDNRTMIIADREAASTTRVEVSKLKTSANAVEEELAQLNSCIEFNHNLYDARFDHFEKTNNEETEQLEKFTKTLSDQYREVYTELKKADTKNTNTNHEL
jgi:hypothetical protein